MSPEIIIVLAVFVLVSMVLGIYFIVTGKEAERKREAEAKALAERQRQDRLREAEQREINRALQREKLLHQIEAKERRIQQILVVGEIKHVMYGQGSDWQRLRPDFTAVSPWGYGA